MNNNSTTGWAASAGPASGVAWTLSGTTQNGTITGYQLGEGCATGQVIVTVTNYNCLFQHAHSPVRHPPLPLPPSLHSPTGAQLTRPSAHPSSRPRFSRTQLELPRTIMETIQLLNNGSFDSAAPYAGVSGDGLVCGNPGRPQHRLRSFGDSFDHGLRICGEYCRRFEHVQLQQYLVGLWSHLSDQPKKSIPAGSTPVPSSRCIRSPEPRQHCSERIRLPLPESPRDRHRRRHRALVHFWRYLHRWHYGWVQLFKIQVQGHVILVVTGRLGHASPSTGYIEVLPDSQLEIFVRGDTTISLNGGFKNDTGLPKKISPYIAPASPCL